MLEKLAKNHKLWLKILINLGCNNSVAEDIVQEMYIRMDKYIDDDTRILIGEEINRYFIYKVLRNLYMSHLKNKGKMTIYPILDSDNPEDDYLGLDHHELESAYFHFLKDKLNDIIKGLEVYHQILYDLHFIKGQSQRKIARESGVSLTSVNNDIVNIKRLLKYHLLEDIQDYYNQDFNQKQ